MADDLGFSDLGCYGSEIDTPVLDALGSAGTVFSNFHAAATCSPTRAMLLTGVDHHRAGMGNMYEFLSTAPAQIGSPGYEGHLNDSVLTIAEVLKQAGYHTAISGKWHLGARPVASQAPAARGFDQSWVLWTGWSEHFFPAPDRIFLDGNKRVPYPQGRYSTEVITDKAIRFADTAIDRQEPFFLFAAYTAPHWPLEAPAETIARQKGNYDDGYEALRDRRIAGLSAKGIISENVKRASVPARRPQLHHSPPVERTRSWNQLNDEERRYSSRLMEVHAAMVATLDQQIGRLLRHLQDRGQLNNTLIVFLSDNGAAPYASSPSEPGNQLDNVGRPGSFVGFGPEWARASCGPLRLMKGHSTEGGTRVPAIIKLPHQKQHRVTPEFASVLDIAPTIYDIVNVTYPKRMDDRELAPLDGVSMLPYLAGQRLQLHTDDYSMGWELFGRAAFRQANWKITWIEKPFGPSEFGLFEIDSDPGETHDLRAAEPQLYQRLAEGFASYLRRNGVIIARPESWQP